MRYRVLHLLDSNERRGAEVFAWQLASNLSPDLFHSVLCVVHPVASGGLPFGDVAGITLGASKKRTGLLNFDISSLWSLYRALRDFRPHILLAHGSSALKYGASSLALHREPVAIYRNIGMVSSWPKSALKARLNRWMLNRFDAVVSLSEKTRQDFLQVYRLPPDRVSIIPNGVDTRPFEGLKRQAIRNEYRLQLGLSEYDILLVTVGSLSSEKDQSQLVSLVHDAHQEGVATKLLIVGEGPLRGVIEEQIRRLDMKDLVMLLGLRDDVPALLTASDIFVLPSKTEAMPGVLIEAGLAGLPSVAYDIGAITDTIQDEITGKVAPENNYTEFKEAALQLIASKKHREAIGNAARIRCQELFDIRKIAQRYESLFISVLAGSEAGLFREPEGSLE